MQLTFKHGRLKRSLEEMASSGLLKDLDGRTILWGISQIYLNTAEVCSWPYTKYNTCHAKSCTQSTTIKGQKKPDWNGAQTISEATHSVFNYGCVLRRCL